MALRTLVIIFDNITQDITGNVGIYRNVAPAIRMFSDAAADKEPNPVNQHLKDVELWQIGTLDDETMELATQKIVLETGANLIKISAEQHK